MCEICELETEEIINIESFHVCKDCFDEQSLKEFENNSCERCVICNWPINKILSKETINKLLKGVKEWLEKNSNKETFERIFERIKFLENKEISICRYDFFSLIKEIVEDEDKKLSEGFEKILKAFDFEGSLIS